MRGKQLVGAGRTLTRRDKARGQSFAELALVLPIVLILVAAGIDFGRLFTGWISLQNAARIAANYAAADPDGPFTGTASAYQTSVNREAANINCTMPNPIPTPTFTPDNAVGSNAKVELTCTFRLLTPILASIVGNQFPMSAQSTFVVRSGSIPGVPVPPPLPCVAPNLVVPNLVGLTVADARVAWTAAGFTGQFNPNTGVPNKIVTGQIPDVGACRAPNQTVAVAHT